MCSSELVKHSRGIMAMRLRLYFDKFGAVKVPFPPLEEQRAIADFLQQAEADFEKACSSINMEIMKLNEFRNILIADVVTGKIKV